MRIAVFGANGQLGQCFQDTAKSTDKQKYLFYSRDDFDISNSLQYSALNPLEIDLIINCAAYTAVDRAEGDREAAYRINVTGAKMLADFGVLHNIPLIHFSTDYVYGDARAPINEDHPVHPVNYYGLTKWKGEEEIKKSGIRHLIFRTSWLYSEYGHNFVKTMLRLADDRNSIGVVNDQIGSPTYAQDLAAAVDSILCSVSSLDELNWGAYNFSNRGAVTWYEFACEILKEKNVNIHPILSSEYPTSAARPAYSVLDVSKFEKVFERRIPEWKDGLERCLSHVKSFSKS